MSLETYETVWAHIRPGAVVAIRGELLKVVAREPLTVLETRAGLRRSGSPKPGAAVVAVMPTYRPVTMEAATAVVAEMLGATDVTQA
jgi:hypothetical protein